MLALHGCFAIESLEQLGLATVVVGNLADSNIHYLAWITRTYHHLAQLDGGGLKFNLQILGIAGIQRNLLGFVT